MNIPRDKIDEVLAAANIVDVVGEVVRLRKSGRNYLGLCPFHVEKTPSFTVSAEKSLFKCFGCGKGGNVITFLMEQQKTSFPETVRLLARRYGISLPEETDASRQEDEGREALYQATQYAADFFAATLASGTGAAANKYLHKRKWSEETRKRFHLGCAPAEWDALLRTVVRSGRDAETFLAAGLFIRRDDGTLYDRFRNRLVFPIHSPFGKIVGFGARVIEKGDEPKYINSPETPVYNKSQVLYGLFQASRAIRERECVVLVEGYADVISLAQAGILNVVATSGTSLTPEQIRLIARYSRNFYFVYDADSAGAKAMIRGIDLIIEQGFDVKIIRLPAGEDPDSFVQSRGREAFDALQASALSFVDYIITEARAEGKFDSPEQKSLVLRRVLGLLAKLDDEIRRDFYIKRIAESYDVYETVLYRELQKLKREARRGSQRREEATDAGPAAAPPAASGAPSLPPLERDFLANFLRTDPAELAQILPEVMPHIRTADFTSDAARSIVEKLLEQWDLEGTVRFASLELDLEEEDLRQLVAELSIDRYTVSRRWSELQNVREPEPGALLLENYRGILGARLDARVALHQKRLKESGDTPETVDLVRQYQLLLAARQRCMQVANFAELDGVRQELGSFADVIPEISAGEIPPPSQKGLP